MPAPGARVLWNALFNKPRSTVPRQPLPVLSPSRAELDATVDGSLFRLGHSTLLLKLAGSWWLTYRQARCANWTGGKVSRLAVCA